MTELRRPPLPPGFSALPFAAARPLPQRVTVPTTARRLSLALVASGVDPAGVAGAAPSDRPFDLESARRPVAAPAEADPALRFERPPGTTLAPPALRLDLVLLRGGRPVAARPVQVQQRLRLGDAVDGTAIEIFVAVCDLPFSSIAGQPDEGARLNIGWRPLPAAPDHAGHSTPTSEEDPYDALV